MDNARKNTLTKKERLSGKKDISNLLSKGRYGDAPGFRYCVLCGNGLTFNRIIVSVPKRNFKRAVKRNLIKRRIRESYRLNKYLLDATMGGYDILFIYSGKQVLDYKEIVSSVQSVLKNIGSQVSASGKALERKEAGNE